MTGEVKTRGLEPIVRNSLFTNLLNLAGLVVAATGDFLDAFTLFTHQFDGQLSFAFIHRTYLTRQQLQREISQTRDSRSLPQIGSQTNS